jgi:membrane protease YdiL (CAAX protease family)
VRAFAWFTGLLLLAMLGAALLAYPAYELVAGAGWRFDRIASRVAMLLLLLELLWLCRRLGIRSKADFGYDLPWRQFLTQALCWGAIGVLTGGLGAVYLLASGLRAPVPGFSPGIGACAHLFLIGLGSGVTVALIEETVMRGGLHTAIARESGQVAAALLTATLFACCTSSPRRALRPISSPGTAASTCCLRSVGPLLHPLPCWIRCSRGRRCS